MKQVKLSCGVTVVLSDDFGNDMELLELCADMEEDARFLPAVVNRVFTPAQKEQVYNALRNENGVVPIDAVTACVAELFSGLGEQGKN